MGNPIGIFDSGIGGLTVYQEIRRLLPHEDLVYVGDTARVPYGTKSKETVIRYSRECVEFLVNQKVKMVVIACNTASALALGTIEHEVSLPLCGVLVPGVRGAVQRSKRKKIGVIATEGTTASGAYPREIRRLDPSCEVLSISCPLFVPLAEEGWTHGEVPRLIASQYLAPLKDFGADTLILGCTHYPLLKPVLQEVARGIVLVDSAEETAKEVATTLTQRGIETDKKKTGTTRFFVTDSPSRFQRVGEIFLGHPLHDVTKISL